MGRKGSWLSSVKKVIGHSSREKKEKKARKSKGWFWKKNKKGLNIIQEIGTVNPSQAFPVLEMLVVDAEGDQTKYIDSVMWSENEQSRHGSPAINFEIVQDNHANLEMDGESEKARYDYVVARATSSATSPKSKEQISALKIQAVFKGYMARMALLSIKGLVRLKTLVQGRSVKRQSITTLRCMQTMSRVQAEVRARRIRMSEENCAFQRQLQQKHHKEVEKSRPSMGEDWNGSTQSKEQVEANKQRKLEAAIKRERTLAYAYAHQQTWRNLSEPTYTLMDPECPQWGWNWLERWMAVRPWENRAIEKEQIHVKSVGTLAQAHRDLDLVKKPSSQIIPKRQSLAPGRISVSTPQTKTNNMSVQNHRKSVSSATQSSVRDDESVASSSAVHNRYMVPTESAKAKSRFSVEKNVLTEKDSVGTTKKRLSFSTFPSAPRRQSIFK